MLEAIRVGALKKIFCKQYCFGAILAANMTKLLAMFSGESDKAGLVINVLIITAFGLPETKAFSCTIVLSIPTN